MWICERQGRFPKARPGSIMFHIVSIQSLLPVRKAPGRDGEGGLYSQSNSESTRFHIRPGEEGKVSARVSDAVCIEQMIRTRIVLVHAPLHEAHAEQLDVEIQVFLGIPCNAGDVMNAMY
jgi:hypothetical protein